MSGCRVVITGIDLVTALGIGCKSTWQGLCEGRSGAGPITRFEASGFATRIAHEVPAAALASAVDRIWLDRRPKASGLCDQMLRVTMAGALLDAGLDHRAFGPRVGIVIGTTAGGAALPDDHRVAHFFPSNEAPSGSIWSALEGYDDSPQFAVATACASGAHAVALGYDLIRSGRMDVAVVGATEAAIAPYSIASFNSMLALSMRNDEPSRASRPFDRQRDGFVMGDGAAVVVLEKEPLARRRGVGIYAEMLGYGATSEAASMAVPREGGIGMARTMQVALEDAHLEPERIDYVSAHGTSTPANDACETQAIKRVFGSHGHRLAISSQKSMLGHTIGAAGTIELAVTALTVRHGVVTPTINYEEPDPDCDLFYTPNLAIERRVRFALSNSFAFGGHNCTIALGRYENAGGTYS